MSPGTRPLQTLPRVWLLVAIAAGTLPAAGQPGGEGQAPREPRKAAPAQARPSPPPGPAQAPPQTPPQTPAGYPLTPGFTVKPSDIVLPADVPLGQYRRSFRPFPNWTLICDENLVRRQKVCNISQTVLGPDGTPVLSWSLAANQGGDPLFILRTPTGLGEKGEIRIDLPDGGPPLAVPVTGCDAKICLAYLPASPRLRAAVGKGMALAISYAVVSPPGAVSFKAPLEGLSAALAGI